MKWNKLFWLKRRLKQIEDEIMELTVLSAVAMNGMPSGNSVSSPVERYHDRKEKLEAEKAKAEQKVEDEKKRLKEMLENIEDEEIQTIAYDRLYYCKDWETIGRENCMERTTAYKKLRNYFERNEIQ